jgi:hypothetical protein
MDPKGAQNLKERKVKINKGFYEVEGGGVHHKKIRWPLYKVLNDNSKSYINITYFKEKIHMLNIF